MKLEDYILFLVGIVVAADAWSGNTCTRVAARYYTYSYCSCYIWWSCVHRRHVTRTYYVIETYCCAGWRHNRDYNCNIPICSPNCINGGKCINPNTCQCPAGYTGDICGGIASCSHLSPCYPGRCYGNNLCMCSDGFSGSGCVNMENDDFKPMIEKSNATFAKYSYTKKTFAYQFMTDATNMTEVDYVWTNQEEFNVMKFDVDASVDTRYTFSYLPVVPRYIRNFKLGIVAASVSVVHYKLNSGGEYIVNQEKFVCPQPSNTKPIAGTVLECRLDNGTNVYQVDSGDRYRVIVNVTTGGFRELINTDNNFIYRTDVYNGKSSENVMEFRFDYDVPVHCLENNSCSASDVPLVLEEDITKKPLKPRWSGWVDKLSGVKRYAFEVWKLEYSLDYKGLREPDILPNYNPIPVNITETLESSAIKFPEYEPLVPGVYSTILEVADKANNSKYVRRIAIYDKTSVITTSEENPLYAVSASNESEYMWQTIPSNERPTELNISWEKHFVNKVHEEGHFLEKVLHYQPRLSDNVRRVDYKKILEPFDDNEGKRSRAAIPNINSIIRFEIIHSEVSSLIPEVGWHNVTPLREKENLVLTGLSIRDGDSRKVWVRAHDVMGNTKVDSTTIFFDSSPPVIGIPNVERNVKDGDYPFSSRITIHAQDSHSGIVKVSFKFIVNRTGEVKNQKDFIIKPQPEDSCDVGQCYCINDGRCFMFATVLDINNCWLRVPIDRVEDELYKVEIIVYNLAMLSSRKTQGIGMVNSFNGIQQYYSPSNISIQKTTDTSLSISWIQAPTCYNRAGILIRLFRPDNSTRDFQVHKDATTFDLTGLSPTTNYWFKLYTKYGNDTHFVMSGSPGILQFQTAEASRGFPPGGVGGLSAGFILIIIIIVVVLIFLGRTGRLQPAKARVTQGIRTIRNTIRYRQGYRGADGYNNRAYSSQQDDDIYYYGQMQIKNGNNTIISRKDISFESQLAVGRFATIYLAKYYNKQDVNTVVAKVLKDDQNEENIMKMKAKINFYAEKVGHHKNVLDFIGSVQDDVRGPFMVLEYCEKGILKDFLVSCKENVTVDLEERLFRMIFGICLGMDYLSSRKIVHRRLAARNILLDHLHEPKISGFGPSPETVEEGEELIPMKWMAPECMKSTRRANELSDVFSFGVVMWEIFSLGDTPYPGIHSKDVLSKQKQGYKMKRPEYCDDAFYKVMLKCWHFDPNKRIGFAEIKKQLTTMFQEGPGEEYYYRSNDI